MADTKYKAVFMDFYGTLSAGDADSIDDVCAQVIDDFGLDYAPAEFSVLWGQIFFKHMNACRDNGFSTLYECECESLRETCAPLCGAIDPTVYVDRLVELMSAPELHPESKEILSSLPIPVCCVSNADDNHLFAAIERHGLEFAAVVSSEGARSYKPEGGIFDRALDTMNLDSDEVIHVGDSLFADIGGAQAKGIDAVWICREGRIFDIGDAEADHKISDLRELHSIL